MRVCIHAYPKRMWYVEEFLVPMLKEQGAEVEVWNDTAGRGNLLSCVESFAARTGDGACPAYLRRNDDC